MPSLCLSDLSDGAPHFVLAVHGDPLLRERLVELGFTPGQRVEIVSRAAFGGPLHVRVRGGHLAIRRDEASCVAVTLALAPAELEPAACGCDADEPLAVAA